jgi:hypothetical protein
MERAAAKTGTQTRLLATTAGHSQKKMLAKPSTLHAGDMMEPTAMTAT